jgi:hypothetical protein
MTIATTRQAAVMHSATDDELNDPWKRRNHGSAGDTTTTAGNGFVVLENAVYNNYQQDSSGRVPTIVRVSGTVHVVRQQQRLVRMPPALRLATTTRSEAGMKQRQSHQ